MAMALGP